MVSITSAQLFPDNDISSFTNLLPEQLNLEGEWEAAISELSYASMYQKFTEGKLIFFDGKLSKLSEFCCRELGLYPSIADIVEAMNALVQGKNNHNDSFITVKLSRRTQKVEIYPVNEGSGRAFFGWELRSDLAMNLE